PGSTLVSAADQIPRHDFELACTNEAFRHRNAEEADKHMARAARDAVQVHVHILDRVDWPHDSECLSHCGVVHDCRELSYALKMWRQCRHGSWQEQKEG